MINLLKDIIVDFILFSGIEGIIFCLFYTKVYKCNKISFLKWFIFSIVNSIISKIFPPVIYQIIMTFWIFIFLYFINKNENITICIKSAILSMCIFVLLEIPYSVLLEYLFRFESLNLFLTNFEKLTLFVLIIPLRIFEIISIYIMEVIRMKVFIGGVVRK